MAVPTPKTRVDLAKQAMVELRVLRVDGALTDAQKRQVDDKYDGLYAELGIQGLAYWPDQDAIPIEVFSPLAMLVAQELQSAFGKQYTAGDAMTRLRIAAGKKWSGKTVRSLYY